MFEGVTPEDINDKNLLDINYGLEINQTTFSKLEFDKHDLFFRSFPNKINFDKVLIKNTGTTCIYFKWLKLNKAYNLPDKKSDGIDRFFCHYSDSKLFPNEEKYFTFSFFSEKNGLFNEEWILITSPPLKSSNLIIHLTGMCLQIQDKYSDSIKLIDNKLSKSSFKTSIYEMVMDLIGKIKEDDPPLPNMEDEEVFKFYFQLYNKEFNVVFSLYAMKNFKEFINQINSQLGISEQDLDSRFWNGSIQTIINLINKIPDELIKEEFLFKLNNLIHLCRKPYPQDSIMYKFVKNLITEITLEFPEVSTSLREELILPPSNFDYLTKQSLSEQELIKYNQDSNKRKDDFYKKSKKKPPKNLEEEESELTNYKNKLIENINEKFLNKFNEIDIENFKNQINENIIYGQILDDDYIDRVSRIKSLKSIKNEGLEGKNIILRVDIEKYTVIYEETPEEDEKVSKKQIKYIEFPSVKDTILQSMNFMFDNRAKSIILLSDFGPKTGIFNADFSMKYLYDYLLRENLLDQPIYFISDLEEISDFDSKLENEIFKENCLIIVENLNFFPEEVGFEYEKIESENNSLIIKKENITNLKFFTKMLFLEKFMKGSTYINDSTKSINKKYPTVIDFKFLSDITQRRYVKAIGLRLHTQIQKITKFLTINSQNFVLVIGDDDNINDFEYVNKVSLKGDEEKDGSWISEEDRMLFKRLLILNFILLKFKVVFIFGKLALYFIHFIQKDYIFARKYNCHVFLGNLIKFIIAKAELNNVEIVLPEDARYLQKVEYMKYYNSDLNYSKYIKNLFKREKAADDLENLISDEDELNENPDYLKNKLNEEEKELINIYKKNSIEFKTNAYIKLFFEIQQISNPKKILKNELENYYFLKDMYLKEIISPYPGILDLNKTTVISDSFNNDLKIEKSQKENNINPGNTQKKNSTNNFSVQKTLDIKYILDPKDYVLIDYGQKSYEKLTQYIGKMNCIMWLGKLSPSIVENIYDNYADIVKTIYDRKTFLREKFNELMMEEEKKLDESDKKAKKHLFNVFLKGKISYEFIKTNYKNILSLLQGNNPNEEEEEQVNDDEQFNYEMNILIDHFINEEFEVINDILSGEVVKGIYGLDEEDVKEKEEELDLKFLDEI